MRYTSFKGGGPDRRFIPMGGNFAMKLASVIAAGSVAVALALAGAPTPAQAQLIAATSHPLGLPWVGAIKNFFIPEVNKRLAAAGEPTLEFNEQFPLPGLPPTGVLETIQDGTS